MNIRKWVIFFVSFNLFYNGLLFYYRSAIAELSSRENLHFITNKTFAHVEVLRCSNVAALYLFVFMSKEC